MQPPCAARWLPYREAMRALGLTEGQFKNHARKGLLTRRQGDGGLWLYLVEGDPLDDTPKEEPPAAPQEPDDLPASVGLIDGLEPWVERDGYVYDRPRDTYVITVRSLRAPLVMQGSRVRAIWSAYAGDDATIAEVCRKFSLSRQLFIELKAALGLTKTRAQWTDEEIEARPEDDLITDLIRDKERRVLVEAERRDWRAIKRDADRWRLGPQALLDGIKGLDLPALEIPDPPPARGRHTIVLGLTDLHVGKRPHAEQGDLSAQVRRLASMIGAAIAQALDAWGAPERWIIPIGSDLLHVDTLSQTTTAGTPQGAQSVGSTLAAWRAALLLVCGAIERAARSAPVLAPWIPGNHDRLSSFGIAAAAAERFRLVGCVEVDLGESARKCYSIHGAPVLLDHGDQVRARDWPAILANEAPPGCDLRRGVVFVGHLHQEQLAATPTGVRVVTMSSPSAADDWHHSKGYLSRQEMAVYRVGEGGLSGALWVGAG